MSGEEFLPRGLLNNKYDNIILLYDNEPHYHFPDIWKIFVVIGSVILLYMGICGCCIWKNNNQIKLDDNPY